MKKPCVEFYQYMGLTYQVENTQKCALYNFTFMTCKALPFDCVTRKKGE